MKNDDVAGKYNFYDGKMKKKKFEKVYNIIIVSK